MNLCLVSIIFAAVDREIADAFLFQNLNLGNFDLGAAAKNAWQKFGSKGLDLNSAFLDFQYK